MFDYFYYYSYVYPPFFLNSIFSLFLIILLGIITPFIIKLANKDKDYKNKIFFIIYKKAIIILLILHIILTLINFLLIKFIFNLVIGVIGIAIIYGICYFLNKNNIDKPNIKKFFSLTLKIIYKIFYEIGIYLSVCIFIVIPMGAIIFLIILLGIHLYAYFGDSGINNFQSFLEYGSNNSTYMPILLIITFILLCIFLLLFIILCIICINAYYTEEINEKLKNNKSASSTKLETAKKDNKDNDYII